MSEQLKKLLEPYRATELLKVFELLKSMNLINELGDSVYFELKHILTLQGVVGNK